jgi:plastocyanin
MRPAPVLRSVLLHVAFALPVGLAACGSSITNPSAAAASVSIKNFAFSPALLTARVGDTITIMNNDTLDHTVTDSGGAFDTGHIAPGKTKTITITKAGTYAYHCNIHSFMKGTIQVS